MSHYNLPHNHGQNIERVLDKMPSVKGFTNIAFLFQQLDDPTRLRILWLLCHCEECVCNIAAAVDMSAPAVSHHLRILKKVGSYPAAGKEKKCITPCQTHNRLNYCIVLLMRYLKYPARQINRGNTLRVYHDVMITGRIREMRRFHVR